MNPLSPDRAERCLRCGHPFEMHAHYRAGADCGACECPRFGCDHALHRRYRVRELA